MKKTIVLFFLACAGLVSAQVEIKDQPGNAYFDFLKQACIGKMPSQSALLTMKTLTVPLTFMDTLKKYDWVAIGSYSYTDKQYEDNFAQSLFAEQDRSQYQFGIFRIMADGMRADFSLGKFQVKDAYVTTTTFDRSSATTYDKLKVSGKNTFIQATTYGTPEYLRVVSYKEGVLVIDITISGKITDLKTRFRNVYKAIPKKFDWKI
ncbi:MAG TPA: hypothetical protein VK177_13275 [Flavobacteriales bacterium]|nr:hypothetical protein [Flavobacteriales bacterium]